MGTSTHALTEAKAAWRTHAMLRAMSGDILLREQFATDPMQVYCDYVAPGRVSGEQMEAANQLVFSVFSSPQLRRWMGDYSRRLRGHAPSRHLFAKQFAHAAAASRDPLVALALVRGAAAGEGKFELMADFFRAVLAAMGKGTLAETGTEMSPGVTATEMSPGATGTEMSPGALSLAGRVAAEVASAARVAIELRRIAAAGGTEMSPGGGTEQSPGGTEMSPGALRLALSLVAAIRRAERFSELLLRADGGTEMSPGTATEMSPGVTATEMSPGAIRSAEQLITEVRIAARLATSLLASEGTEMSPGGGTEVSPGGGGTEMSPGKFDAFEALIAVLRRAELFSMEVLRSAEGTEMSPGTATEMSPGVTATEMSPGAAIFGIAERLRGELASAARFSAELVRLESGTEMSPGGGTEMSPGGTEMSPGALRLNEGLVRAVLAARRLSQLLVRSDGGTEMSPGATATEMSPGARPLERLAAEMNVAVRYANALQKSATEGTDMSPGGGTEMSPGGGTEMSPGGALKLTRLLAASVRRSQLFLSEILRVAEGTEMSPGGTEVSPGGGTEVSPGGTEVSPGAIFGGVWDVQLPVQVGIALGAVVQYAVGLRRQGALDVSGLEIG
jgi:hypothetical protein